MFDANLLKEICTAKEIFWAGMYPPAPHMTVSQRLFDHGSDFRQSPSQHGKFHVVYLVEYNLGQFKQWPLILDEALRLLQYGARSKLFVRLTQTRLLSLFAFASFLLRRKDFSFELVYQETYPDGTITYCIDCGRTALIPALDSFEFALITDGKRPDRVRSFIDSVKSIRGIDSIRWSIAICGPLSSKEDCTRRSDRVRFIEHPNENTVKGWITRKKNMIVQTSTAENLLVVHDRYEVPPAFLEEMFEFGADFSVVVPAQVDTNDRRFPDWVTIASQWYPTPGGMLPYGDYSPNLYINGGAIVSKRQVLIDTPWNDLLFWDQYEDVELTRRLTGDGITPRLARLVTLTVTEARPDYTAGFLSLPMIAHAYPVKHGTHDPAQIGIGVCNVGELVSFRQGDLTYFADKGVVANNTDWACTEGGLLPLHRNAPIALNLEARGESNLYLEVSVRAATPQTTMVISIGNNLLQIEWSPAANGIKRGIALLNGALGGEGSHVMLTMMSSDAILLTALGVMRADYSRHQYPVSFSSESRVSAGILGSGWGATEPWGVWSEGAESTLSLPIIGPDTEGDIEFRFTAVAYGPVKGYRQIVGVVCNGVPLTCLDIAARKRRARFLVRIPRNLIRSARCVELSLIITSPTSPEQQGQTGDPRKLGIGLIKIEQGPFRSSPGWSFTL